MIFPSFTSRSPDQNSQILRHMFSVGASLGGEVRLLGFPHALLNSVLYSQALSVAFQAQEGCDLEIGLSVEGNYI